MNKKRIVAGIVIMLLTSCTHYIDIYRTVWQDKTVLVDGNPTEWSIPLQFYDEKSQLQYTVSNDKENLYVCIRATNEQTQTKMFRAGLNIWIDTTGKDQQHQVGIAFPLPNNNLKRTVQSATPEIRNTEKPANTLKSRYITGYKEMELTGFKSPISGMTPLQNNYGIAVSIDWDSTDIMTYEAIIPFRTFYKGELSNTDTTRRLGVSIVLHALPTPEATGSGGHSGGGGMRGGGGGVPGGGGMGGGMRGGGGGMHGGGGGHGGSGHSAGGSQGSPYLFETNTIKMIFQLSTKKRA